MAHMPDPIVCAIMLTRDRPEMAARAVRSFEAQTYERKYLVVLDTTLVILDTTRPFGEIGYAFGLVPKKEGRVLKACNDWSIGKLRNAAIDETPPFTDIIVTFDDDDYSHPARIAEQVALLQSSGAACVGYSQTLFWDTVTPPAGQAWIYSGAPIGASFAYWRKTWKEHPFEDVSRGEDDRFWRALLVAGKKVGTCSGIADEPRMIHHVHGGNTWTPDYAKAAAHGSNNWRRAPEWDDFCRERMAL